MEEPHRLSVSSNPVPDGVELMLTKSSEEELEHGAAPLPPCEARSRSGGSWGSLKTAEKSLPPKAARAKLCSAAKPSIVPSAAGRAESELTRGQDTFVTAHPTPPRPFEAKRWRSEGGGGRDNERDAEAAAAASVAAARIQFSGRLARPPATNFSRSWRPGPAASGARAQPSASGAGGVVAVACRCSGLSGEERGLE
jgi:hypothetical protein